MVGCEGIEQEYGKIMRRKEEVADIFERTTE